MADTKFPIRRAFIMRLKPNSLDEYIDHHNTLREKWPALAEEIEKSGIASITIFEQDPVLVLVSEIYDEEAWDKLWHSQIHDEWGSVMNPLMHYREDGIVDSSPLNEVFRFETNAGKS